MIKIQYPDARRLFKTDISTAKMFTKLAQPEQVIILDELEKQFLEEFDFAKEANSLATVNKNMAPFSNDVVVPKPIKELCTPTVVVMEFIPGSKLIDSIVHDNEKLASVMGTTLEKLKNGKFTAFDKASMSVRYTLNSLKVFSWNSFATLNNSTLGWLFPGYKVQKAHTGLDIKHMFHILFKVHGKQVLIDGVLNGDPHPGNILVTPEGKLGLIDYGQVKKLTKRQRRELAKLIILLGKGESAKQDVIAHIKHLGFETFKNDDFVLYKTTVIGFDRDDAETCEGKSVQAYMEMLNERDQTKKIPEHYVLAVRCCIILRGMAASLGLPAISVAKEWHEMAVSTIEMFPEDAADDDELPA